MQKRVVHRQQIKKYTLHILAIRAITEDTFDLPPERNAVIVCTIRDNRIIDAMSSRQALRIPFPDYEDKTLSGAFNNTDAGLIIRFIDNLPDTVTDIYVCCSKGGSRSPAVAAALLRASDRSDMVVWRNPYYVPNTLVYQRLCQGFGLRASKLSVWRRVCINNRAFRKAQKNKGSANYERWQILE